MQTPDWPAFLRTARPRTNFASLGLTLCLDPGETTGWALFLGGGLLDCGQEPTPGPADMARFIHAKAAIGYPLDSEDAFLRVTDRIVYEEYRVRGNKFKEHVGSEVVTIQHIGAIKVVAAELKIKLYKQTAGMAKGFVTDAKLRRWGLYQPNRRHANDAIRHGCHWFLFAAGREDPRPRVEEADSGAG